MRDSGSAVPRNIAPSSEIAVDSSLRSSEPTRSFMEVIRWSVDSGRLSALPAIVSPSAAYGPALEAGSKSRYCSPTADRLCT